MTDPLDRRPPNDLAALAAAPHLRTLANIRLLADQLDPYALLDRITELQRGTLPRTSIPNGSRSAERPLPARDRLDHELDGARHAYEKNLAKALELLRRARAIQRGIQEPITIEKANQVLIDEAQGTENFVCIGCGAEYLRSPTQRPRNSRCRYCNDWWCAHGRPLPPNHQTPIELVAAIIEREAIRKADR